MKFELSEVFLPVGGGTHPRAFGKQTGEVGAIVESQRAGDLADLLLRIDQHAPGSQQDLALDIAADVFPGYPLHDLVEVDR